MTLQTREREQTRARANKSESKQEREQTRARANKSKSKQEREQTRARANKSESKQERERFKQQRERMPRWNNGKRKCRTSNIGKSKRQNSTHSCIPTFAAQKESASKMGHPSSITRRRYEAPRKAKTKRRHQVEGES
jgi:hypothetical protein